MAHRRIVYRDYRNGGRFTTEETYNRSQAQGKECNIHREYIEVKDINDIDDLFDIEDEPDLEEFEFHATGDTGRRKK